MLARDNYPMAGKIVCRHVPGMSDFVELLRQRIDADPDLTPAGLASRAGIDNSTIRKILNGQNRSPRIDTAMKICAALGTTLEDFMGVKTDPVQREIVRLYVSLTEDERRLLLAAAKGLAAERL